MVPRTRSVVVRSASALALMALLAGCGSSGGSTSPLAAGGLNSANGLTQGVITGFGTIHLGHGAKERVFHTEGAKLSRFDDGVTRTGGFDDATVFRVGMKVRILTSENDSTRATEVTFMDDLEGPITAKPSTHAGATFDVLGVPVLVDANTRFDDSFGHSGLTLDSLQVGNVVELSGDFDAGGVLHATFIEGEQASAMGRTFEMKGQVTDLSGAPPTQTFKVNGASFTTDQGTQLEHLPAGLVNGAFVQVKTMSTSAPLVATKVEGLNEESGDSDGGDDEEHHIEKVSVEGFVTDLTGTSPNFSFTLDTRHVVTSSATKGLALVAPNAHLQAKGPVDSTGTIAATKIETENDD